MIEGSCNSAVGELAARSGEGNTPAVAQRTDRQFGSDEELELAIARASDTLGDAVGRPAKLAAWRELVRLIDLRSIHQVRFMERMRGIA